MHKLPIQFYSYSSASGDFSQTWKISSRQSEAICSIPSEFGGQGGGFSPEDLFLQAIINCFVGTFKVYANSSKVIFSSLSVKGTLSVDRNSIKQISMNKCFLDIEMLGVENPERARNLVTKALREGFILNSVKTEIETSLRFNEASDEKVI